MGQLNLRVLIEAVDRASKPLRGISRGMSALSRPAKAAGLAIRSLGRDLRNVALVGAAATAAVSVALWRVFKSTADAGDAAVKTSQKVGVGVEAWQRYVYAAQLADVGSEELADGLKYLNQSAAMAAAGAGGDAKAFRALGISVRDQKGQLKPTGQLFEEVASRLATMQDGAEKTTLAMILMGRSGTNLIPLLNSGGDEIRRLGDEAQRLGIVIPEDQARSAEVFNDSITTLQAAIRGLSMGVAGGLLPQLTELIQKTTAWIAANKPAIIARMQALILQISEALPGILKGLGAFAALLGDIAKAAAPVVELLGGFGVVLDLLAGLMIGRVAVAIWMAVKAVWGLNAAMYANPVGLIIAGLAALVFAGWLLYRNWDRVVAALKRAWSGFVSFFRGLGAKMKSAFKLAIDALWRMLPPWLRTIMRGGAFVLRVVGRGLSGGPPNAPGARPQVGTGNPRAPNGQVAITVHQDGRPASVRVRGDGVALKAISGSRGGYGR